MSDTQGAIGACGPREHEAREAVDVIGGLRGFDTETALTYLNGNKELYARMLDRFRSNYRHMDRQYYEAVQKDDMEEAARIVHTLKGLAGSLGASALQMAAIALDRSFKEGAGDIPELSDECFRELASVVSSLDMVLGSYIDESDCLNKMACDAVPDCRERIRHFMGLLEDADADAVDYMHENREIFGAVLAQKDLSLLIYHVERYDFDAALELLKENIAGTVTG